MNAEKVYKTFCAGTGTSYKVVLKDNGVDVYNKNKLEHIFQFQKIFVGRNLLPQIFSEYKYTDEEGNTILLEIKKNTYIFIGEKILLFQSISPIVFYNSPCDNLSYPYALDEEGNCYLLIKDVVMLDWENKKYEDDPYQDYYSRNRNSKKSFKPLISQEI
jgi:hypothetical protein